MEARLEYAIAALLSGTHLWSNNEPKQNQEYDASYGGYVAKMDASKALEIQVQVAVSILETKIGRYLLAYTLTNRANDGVKFIDSVSRRTKVELLSNMGFLQARLAQLEQDGLNTILLGEGIVKMERCSRYLQVMISSSSSRKPMLLEYANTSWMLRNCKSIRLRRLVKDSWK
jgi:hypothetical protein